MECPKCGYWLDPLDRECPRCKILGQQPRETAAASLSSVASAGTPVPRPRPSQDQGAEAPQGMEQRGLLCPKCTAQAWHPVAPGGAVAQYICPVCQSVFRAMVVRVRSKSTSGGWIPRMRRAYRLYTVRVHHSSKGPEGVVEWTTGEAYDNVELAAGDEVVFSWSGPSSDWSSRPRGAYVVQNITLNRYNRWVDPVGIPGCLPLVVFLVVLPALVVALAHAV